MNISKQLEAYEVEYHVLQEEMMMSLNTSSVESVDGGDGDRVARLQVANDSLRRQKMELLEQLQVFVFKSRRASVISCHLNHSVDVMF